MASGIVGGNAKGLILDPDVEATNIGTPSNAGITIIQ